jgi:ADP-dependent NAD(P)H-hydrate dehydratase / NAD(P)H-hydrate epimerase
MSETGRHIARSRQASDIVPIDWRAGHVTAFGVATTRRIEADALAALAPFTLMARAGEAVARLALALAPHARRIAVFAGPGNNGGDGLEAALRLQGWGKAVSVWHAALPAAPPADAAQALARARAAGIAIGGLDGADAPDAGEGVDLVIDALLGIGASRPPEGAFAAAIARIAALAVRGAHVLAVDVPSGLDVDRGQPIGSACVVADDTLTLIAPKPGLFTAAGRDHAGRVWCAGLGIDGTAVNRDDSSPDVDAWLVGIDDPSCAPERRRQASHKGSFGDVAVVGGAPGMAGAAWLAARAAHAAGAGRVFVDLLGNAGADVASERPDSIGVSEVDPLRPELMHRRGWSQGDAAAIAATTVVCGCGGGDAVRSVLPRLLSIAPRLVLDADALNAIAADASLLALTAARAARGHATVLTPHPLEAARLLERSAGAVQADRLGAARDLARRCCAVVVLKGSGTVITDVDGPPRISLTGNAALASAGTGDVLAGWIGGRWAALGASALDAATRGVIEHGAAAEPERPGALRAGDLVEALHRRARSA